MNIKDVLINLEPYFNENHFNRQNKNLHTFMDEEFTKYQNQLKELTKNQTFCNEDIFNTIHQECNSLLEIIQTYEIGDIRNALKKFNQLINFLEIYIQIIIFGEKDPKDFFNTSFYRMRESFETLARKEEMFHVPISMRHIINTNRYSIAGLPCLYLSSSIFSCWKELTKPKFDNLYINKYILSNAHSYKILNLSLIDPKRLFNEYTKDIHSFPKQKLFEELDDEKYKSAIVLWPLIFSCSIPVLHKNGSYKAEYILPQFLLQWVQRRKDIDGIAFMSTNSEPDKIDPFFEINYAFPVKDVQNEYCTRIKDIFYLTPPMHWSIPDLYPYEFRDSPWLNGRNFYVENLGKVEYEMTIFGKRENCLEKYDLKKLKE